MRLVPLSEQDRGHLEVCPQDSTHTQSSLSFTYIEFLKITIATSILNNITGFILYDALHPAKTLGP